MKDTAIAQACRFPYRTHERQSHLKEPLSVKGKFHPHEQQADQWCNDDCCIDLGKQQWQDLTAPKTPNKSH